MTHASTTDDAAEAIGDALTADREMQTRAEFRQAALILTAVVALIAVVAVVTFLFGLPALAMVGLVGTLLTFVVILGFSAA
ncbi:MAG: hypothetical protein P3W90_003965 [Paracoccus sp. (in: a-proteobacteria)]|nr:hypothetical protein [Paracoccus sp. (in: a-proteobacteria)]